MPKNPYNLTPQVLKGSLPVAVGDVIFVDSGDGNVNGDGSSLRPFSTIEAAFNKSGLSDTDTIVVMPGHTEDVAGAAGINADVAGVTVLGLGTGSKRPTVTFSATASTVAVAATSITFDNLIFDLTGIDAVVIGIDVNSDNFTMRNCRVIMADSTGQSVTGVDINGGSANTCDNTTIENCEFLGSADAGADEAIELGEVADNVQIKGCTVTGDYANACIHNITGKVMTNLVIRDCILKNDQTGDHSIELVSACTGFLIGNYYHNDMTQATGADTGSCHSFECYHCDVIDKSGIISPAVT